MTNSKMSNFENKTFADFRIKRLTNKYFRHYQE